MDGLFRPEALEHRQRAWIGEIQVLRPLALHVLTFFVVVAALALGAFLFFAHYTTKARVTGVLIPDRGVIRLMPPAAAGVAERRVQEGQTVRRDDVLFVLSVDRETAAGNTQIAVQASLAERERSLNSTLEQQRMLTRSRRAEIERRLSDTRRGLAQLDGELDLVRQRLALAGKNQQRLEDLAAASFVSPAHVQAKAEELLALRAQAAALERQRTFHSGEYGALEAELRDLPLREGTRQAVLERELQELAQQRAEAESRHRIVVRAPQDAVVTAVLAEPGQTVQANAALATLVPLDARLQAHLFAPSSAVGFVRADQPVLLRYQAYPYQKFGHHNGRVIAVSQAPLQPDDLATLPLPKASVGIGDEPLYRITVEIERQSIDAYGQAHSLAAGMQLEADVLLDRRRLIEWIFEPVISITQRV